MHRFAVVSSRGAPAIARSAARLLDELAPPWLTFDPQRHVHWSSANGVVHLGSWSADELVTPTAGMADDGIVALGGLAIVTEPSEVAALLRPETVAGNAHSLHTLTERLDGPYALVAIGRNGSGTIVNDPFGLYPLYQGTFGSSSIVSNDAALVAAVLEAMTGRSPEPDEDAVAWLLLNGQMFGDATPYRGVRRLPFGSGARLEPDGELTVVPWHEPPWDRIGAPLVSLHRSIDDVEQRMVATIRAAIAATPDDVCSELTAGKDSRLVLQLTARAGVVDRVLFRTYGPRNSRDRTVAAEIAQQLGLRHEARWWPSFPGGPTIDDLVLHVRSVSGQISCWEMNTPRQQHGLTFSGLAGESLRTNYPRHSGFTTIDAAEEAFRGYRFGRYRYVRGGALADLQQRSRRLFLEPLGAGAAPEDLFDIFYVQHRLRRWIGDKPDRFGRYVFPLYSPIGVRIAIASGWEARARAAIHEEIARRAQLPRAEIANEQGKRWVDRRPATTDSVVHEADGDVHARPLQMTPRQPDEVRSRAVREAIEYDGANPAFEMVDRDAMLADADRYGELDRGQRIELHHALTVVLWLGLAAPVRRPVRS